MCSVLGHLLPTVIGIVGRLGDSRRSAFWHESQELAMQLTCLLGAVADHHAADAAVAEGDPGLHEVTQDVIQHGANEVLVSVQRLPLDAAVPHLDVRQRLLQLHLVAGGDFLADQAQGVAVGDGGVVVVLVDVVAEQRLGLQLLADQRGTGEADLYRIAVRLFQVGEEATLGVVAAMHLVEEVHALHGEVVILRGGDVRVVLELLDVDHGNLGRAAVVAGGAALLDVAGKCGTAIDNVHGEAAQSEFVTRLLKQIEPVDDEIETRHLPALLEPVGEESDVVVRQRSLAAALSVPDDALAHAGRQTFGDGERGEQLGVAHDVLLDALLLVQPGKGVLQDETEPLTAEQRGEQAVGRRVGRLVALEFGRALDAD